MNLFSFNPTTYGALLQSQNPTGNPFSGGPYYAVTVTDGAPSAPELSTWAMLGLGLRASQSSRRAGSAGPRSPRWADRRPRVLFSILESRREAAFVIFGPHWSNRGPLRAADGSASGRT